MLTIYHQQTHKNMDKFKIVWRQVVVFLKKYWPQVAGSAVFIILLIMFLPVFRSSWLYYPESLRAKIALQKLAESNEKMYYCREDCQAKRLTYKNIIASALSSEKEKVLPDLETTILDKNILPETRTLLIGLWKDSGLPPSDNLKNIQDFNLKAELVSTWPELGGDSFATEIIGNFKVAKNDSEREAALDLLIGSNNPVIINTIWDIILGNYTDELKTKAFFLLANITDKQSIYQADDLVKLRSILESADFPHRLKDKAILAIGDYYELFPEASELLLVDVVNRPQYFDNYQRSFAIDILNNNRSVKVASLNLSQADWDAYFTN